MGFRNLVIGKLGLYTIALLLTGSSAVVAQTITVSGSQTTGLTVSTVSAAGAEPNAVSSTDGSTTYNCSSGNAVYRITAALTTAMPTGTTLQVKLAAPAGGGTSAGFVTLSTTPANVVTGIPKNKTCGATNIQYQFTALASAGVITTPGNTRSVTFQIVTP